MVAAEGVVAARVDGVLVDLTVPLDRDARLELVRANSQEGLEILRHSTAHIMALAVGRLYGSVRFGIGPAIEDGFYYDFDHPRGFAPEDLEKIEKDTERNYYMSADDAKNYGLVDLVIRKLS